MWVVSVDEMRAIEQRAEREYQLSSPVLMEHAGQSVAEHLRARLGGSVVGRETLVLLGPGNNGGDGRVMGRHLTEWGAHVTAYAWRERRIEVDNRYIPVNDDLAAVREAITRADVVVDALLGTGHSRPLDPTMARLLGFVEREKARRPSLLVLALDLPSGLNADTGAVDEGTIHADLTVTLAFPKVGLLLFPGADYDGDLEVGGIGLPDAMPIQTETRQITAASLRPLLPVRALDSNKGTFGKVMIAAGSPRYPGSAFLVTAAAARIGAGLVTIATTPELVPVYTTMLPEATYHPLPGPDAAPEERARALLDGLAGYRALVVGPGLGQDDATRTYLEHVFAGLLARPEDERPRLIVDADGLNNLAQMDDWPAKLPPRTVITPHPGEMGRLLGGEKVSGGGPDRIEIARSSARDWRLIVVLKGACTLVAAPDGPLRANWPPNPALATAGSGDVLSGVVGGLLAQGMEPLEAASAAVYLHSRAGLLVSERIGDAGLLAADLLPELPIALKQVKNA
jgi:NAD(P)H-hydrate epimerase